jgi:galactokinase
MLARLFLRFVIEEIGRTKKAAELLQLNDIAGFGKLMYAAHEGLSKLYEVSCEELDFLVEATRKYPAVIGARLMGGGFGGCTINIVAEDGIDHFVEESSREYQQQFEIIPEAYIVETADGTKEVVLTP